MDEVLWVVGRASGAVALLLLTAVVLLGIVTRSGRPLPGLPRFAVLLAHRNLALLATVFVVLHVGTLLLDSYAKLNLADVVVPFAGSFKPFWQGLGTVAFDLILAIVLTSLLRHRLGLRVFRAVHWFTYAMWPIALLHAVGNGTDASSGWFLWLAVGSVLLVLVGLGWRVSTRFLEPSDARTSVPRPSTASTVSTRSRGAS
jgi:sulfoxide reductase heme-binding subunit YedZ